MCEVNPGYLHNFLFTNRNKNLAGLICLGKSHLAVPFFRFCPSISSHSLKNPIFLIFNYIRALIKNKNISRSELLFPPIIRVKHFNYPFIFVISCLF